MVAEAWDDLDKADLVWMQAHCGEGAVGSKYKGDGSPLTISDIRGNLYLDTATPGRDILRPHIHRRFQDRRDRFTDRPQWLVLRGARRIRGPSRKGMRSATSVDRRHTWG